MGICSLILLFYTQSHGVLKMMSVGSNFIPFPTKFLHITPLSLLTSKNVGTRKGKG